jgi:hypothetical protein
MTTLFLDFDGVLHPEHCHASLHFCRLGIFEQAMRRVADVQIVISSTWRFEKTLAELRACFAADIAARITGCCPLYTRLHDVPEHLAGYEREAECAAWLRQQGLAWSPWLAVDDRSWLFRPFNRNLLLVDGRTGLDQPTCELLIHRLAAA